MVELILGTHVIYIYPPDIVGTLVHDTKEDLQLIIWDIWKCPCPNSLCGRKDNICKNNDLLVGQLCSGLLSFCGWQISLAKYLQKACKKWQKCIHCKFEYSANWLNIWPQALFYESHCWISRKWRDFGQSILSAEMVEDYDQDSGNDHLSSCYMLRCFFYKNKGVGEIQNFIVEILIILSELEFSLNLIIFIYAIVIDKYQLNLLIILWKYCIQIKEVSPFCGNISGQFRGQC